MPYKNPEARADCKRRWAKANPEKVLATQKKYYEANKVQVLTLARDYYKANPEVRAATCRKYYKGNKEEILARNKRWAKANPGKVNARGAKYRADRLQRTPSWADMEAIKRFYECCPSGHEVDHIIPLKGKNISGLHIAENLQWLTVSENRQKGNRCNL
jgi:hypothetical protein